MRCVLRNAGPRLSAVQGISWRTEAQMLRSVALLPKQVILEDDPMYFHTISVSPRIATQIFVREKDFSRRNCQAEYNIGIL